MRSDLKTDYTQRDTERAGQTEKALYLLNTISAITDRGNNACKFCSNGTPIPKSAVHSF